MPYDEPTAWWGCPHCRQTITTYVLLVEPPTHLCSERVRGSRRRPLTPISHADWLARRHRP